tara:strand:+ start:455 stop:763 length:309 start_codon:yes stop_codon:yes gene_type:complete
LFFEKFSLIVKYTMDLVQKICDTDFPLRLISKRGEIIMVNSKPECINYIEGGWKTEIGLGVQDAINIFYPFKLSQGIYITIFSCIFFLLLNKMLKRRDTESL